MKIIYKNTLSVQPPRETTTYILGTDLLANLHSLEILKKKNYTSFLLLLDKNIEKLYGSTIKNSLQMLGKDIFTSIIEPGENSKSLDNLTSIVKPFFDAGFDRNSCLIAAGGGVICDIGGFIASILLRGIDCIYVPTTLLAQVDAAIGGKTGVNFKLSNKLILKNMIGTFKQPVLVLSDVEVLKTLPEKEIKNGLGEVVKYWIGWGKPNFQNTPQGWFTTYTPGVEELIKIIATCQKIKHDIVRKDPYERTGERQKLNLGHTIGHAMEGTAYGKLSHGEAVAIGLIACARLSVLQGFLSEVSYKKIRETIHSLGLPTSVKGINQKDILLTMKMDKKGGTFVLIKDIGNLKTNVKVNYQVIDKVISEVLSSST